MIEPLALTGGIPDMEGLTAVAGGGVTSALGFRAAGVHAGFRDDPDRLDMALVVADEPAACAATFTQNVFCAAPVAVSREHLEDGSHGIARALVVNSGCANAATGDLGLENARETAAIVGDAIGCPTHEVMVASTGVIGVHLDMSAFATGVPLAQAALSREGGAAAARAIMTTDTHSKECAVSFTLCDEAYEGSTFTVGGMAKGSGMIMPDMATMIACITTDVPLDSQALHHALKRAVATSFNKVTVDSDTSTNDCCFAFASGAAAQGAPMMKEGSPGFARFQHALVVVCETLARAMAADGEGATRLVTVRVAGAQSDADADAAARTVANSPLVKTAIFGHDANWGRILCALGYSGANFDPENMELSYEGAGKRILIYKDGVGTDFDEEEASALLAEPEVRIIADMKMGDQTATAWGCDLTYDYVRINGDYRS